MPYFSNQPKPTPPPLLPKPLKQLEPRPLQPDVVAKQQGANKRKAGHEQDGKPDLRKVVSILQIFECN